MKNSRLVYRSEGGDMRHPDERQKREEAKPPDRGRRPSTEMEDGTVRIFRERAGRGGKVVTVIRGLPQRGPALDARAAELRRLCGAGGTVKDGAIEIQGDHRERVAERLRALGYTVRIPAP